MLLELKDLEQSLRAAGVSIGRTDDHLHPNKPRFEITLDENGQVVAVRYIGPVKGSDAGRVQRLGKYVCSKGAAKESTPGFNVTPLFQEREGEDRKAFRKEVGAFQKALKVGKIQTAAARQERLEKLLARCDPNWQGRNMTVNKCLKGAARTLSDQLARVGGGDVKTLEPLCELLRRSQLVDANRLHQGLTDHARRAVVIGQSGADSEQFLQLLFLTAAAKTLAVVLELSDWQRYEYPGNHETVWRTVNRVLVQAAAPPSAANNSETEKREGIFGEAAPATALKMPERKLPRLDAVKIRSQTKDAHCQTRYGLTEDNACPVGLDLREDLAASLEWVALPERKNKTWSDISESCGFEKKALLFAYPSNLPEDLPRLSAFFAGPDPDGYQAESRFEECARTVTERLRGLVVADPRTTVRVFVLLKADRARTKLVYNRQYAVERVLSAAEEWQTAARNLPPIFIRRFNEAGSPCWRIPLVPFPANVVWCLNTCWLKGASENKRVSGLTIGDGLTLLLDSGPNLWDVVVRALRQALANCSPLLLALAQSHRLNKVFRVSSSLEAQPLLLPAIVGLLLAKLGSFRESYMNDNPYLIGRLLSLADRLHRNYCDHERDGKLPPQLLGNALMLTALDNPAAGLARLSEQGNRITQPRNSSQAPCQGQVNRRKIPSEVAPFRRKIHGPRLEDRGVLLWPL